MSWLSKLFGGDDSIHFRINRGGDSGDAQVERDGRWYEQNPETGQYDIEAQEDGTEEWRDWISNED